MGKDSMYRNDNDDLQTQVLITATARAWPRTAEHTSPPPLANGHDPARIQLRPRIDLPRAAHAALDVLANFGHGCVARQQEGGRGSRRARVHTLCSTPTAVCRRVPDQRG